ncbi:MAG: DUF4209 domain-containing protein [Chthoniobacteraceae bacterium]
MPAPNENWLPAAIGDLLDVEIDLPLAGATKRTCREFDPLFGRAAIEADAQSQPGKARLFRSLATLCSFMENFSERGSPFRPFHIEGDRRSAIPDDLTDEDLALVEALYGKTQSPALLARLGDVLFLRKRRRDLWGGTIDAYVSAAIDCLNAEPYDSAPLFFRGLQLADALGRNNPPWKTAEENVTGAIRNYMPRAENFVAARLIGIILNAGAGDPEEWAQVAETRARNAASNGEPMWARRFWRWAARYWHALKNDANEAAAQLNAAEAYVDEADEVVRRQPPNFAAEAQLLTKAVEALRQARADSARVEEVKRRLRSCQVKMMGQLQFQAPEQSPLRHYWAALQDHLAMVGEKAGQLVTNQELTGAMLRLAFGWPVIDPTKLREEVIESAKNHPFNHLFVTEYTDDRGRVFHREPSLLDLAGKEFEEALEAEMFKHAKEVDWTNRAAGFIEPARSVVWQEHRPLLQDIDFIVCDCPFVPAGQQYGLLRGLYAGLSGDWLVASHLIVPRMESCIRHLLELNDVDTSNLYSDLTQPVKLLSALFGLPDTRRLLNAKFHFELRGHLIEKTGFDFRNRLAHGIASDSECYTSPAAIGIWWLFLRICMSFLRKE